MSVFGKGHSARGVENMGGRGNLGGGKAGEKLVFEALVV